jgi:hypothetical protein
MLSLQTNSLDYVPEVEFPEPGVDQFYYLPENLARIMQPMLADVA